MKKRTCLLLSVPVLLLLSGCMGENEQFIQGTRPFHKLGP